jgi:hypothetical protein
LLEIFTASLHPSWTYKVSLSQETIEICLMRRTRAIVSLRGAAHILSVAFHIIAGDCAYRELGRTISTMPPRLFPL